MADVQDESPKNEQTQRRSLLSLFGPALIVAAVVLGPGSILTSSKVGCEYGYSMLWVLALAAGLMAGTTAISATLGQALDSTICRELANRCGRPLAVIVGLTLFLIVACFQSSNNLAVLAGIEPLLPSTTGYSVAVLAVINGLIIVAIFASQNLYKTVERLMKALVGVMAIGFAINLIFARPSIVSVLGGLVPQVPEGVGGTFFPSRMDGQIVDPWWAVQAMVATTFSVAGAFYQAYLVREKGWSANELKTGIKDSIAGIAALGVASGMILVTSAAVLHGNVAASELKTAGDVAGQLEPLFGSFATGLFSLGILAGAFSSFLINAMIGGTLLADGLGWNPSIDGKPMKFATVAALLAGFGFAVGMNSGAVSKVDVIIFAQALTVLGGPVLAFALLYLSRCLQASQRPAWMTPVALIACVVTLALAARTGCRIWLTLT